MSPRIAIMNLSMSSKLSVDWQKHEMFTFLRFSSTSQGCPGLLTLPIFLGFFWLAPVPHQIRKLKNPVCSRVKQQQGAPPPSHPLPPCLWDGFSSWQPRRGSLGGRESAWREAPAAELCYLFWSRRSKRPQGNLGFVYLGCPGFSILAERLCV